MGESTESALDEALGLALQSAASGVAVLRLDPGPVAIAVDSGVTFLHGGALATCVDTAAWYAADSASPGAWVVSSLQLDCLRLARPEPHVVRASCRKTGRTLAVVDVEISAASDPERVVAIGRATLARTAARASAAPSGDTA
jgi:acyl-coenzyme A thioesterase PaaI-like protein